MSEIVKKIEELKKKGKKEEEILNEVIKITPEKKEVFEEAKKRGATAKQIIGKIVADNKKEEEEKKKEEKMKETKKEEKEEGQSKKEQESAKKEEDLKVLKKIEELKKKGKKEEEILNEVIKITPEKKEVFEEAKKRGATAKQIIGKIVADNKKEGKKETKKEEKKAKHVTVKEKIKRKQASIKGNRFLKEFFAATRYLLVGVDISDYSIEVLLLDKDGSVSSYGRSVLEDGVVKNGEILNQKELSEALKETLENTKPTPLNIPEHGKKEKKKIGFAKKEHKAIVSLPESKVYTQTFKFRDRKNLYSNIQKEIERTMPFEKETFYWDFVEVSNKDEIKVVCFAVLQDIADSYIHFFKSTNIDPVAFEIEGESIGRALLPLKKVIKREKKKRLFKEKEVEKEEVMADNKSRMVVDMGARSTMLNIFNQDAVLVVSVPLPYAGNYFTGKVADHFKISKSEANKIKEKEGFKKDGKTYEILKLHGDKIIEEIREANSYHDREFGSPVKEVILAGGTALLPGIHDFFK